MDDDDVKIGSTSSPTARQGYASAKRHQYDDWPPPPMSLVAAAAPDDLQVDEAVRRTRPRRCSSNTTRRQALLAICAGAIVIVVLFAGGSSPPDGILHSLLFHHLQGAYHTYHLYIYRLSIYRFWLRSCQHIYDRPTCIIKSYILHKIHVSCLFSVIHPPIYSEHACMHVLKHNSIKITRAWAWIDCDYSSALSNKLVCRNDDRLSDSRSICAYVYELERTTEPIKLNH
jgi:hypothetical protein